MYVTKIYFGNVQFNFTFLFILLNYYISVIKMFLLALK